MASRHSPNLTPNLLLAYSSAALQNARELLAEASLLYAHAHRARAYFLAIACIEETGKGLQAFDAQKRNLSNPAVTTKLKLGMKNHAQKIHYAFSAWITNSQNLRAGIKTAVDLRTLDERQRRRSQHHPARTPRAERRHHVDPVTAGRGWLPIQAGSILYR